MGTIDNVYVLHYLLNREINKGRRRMERAFFVDLKAVFDFVNVEVLVEAMRERRVEKGLVNRCEDVLKETKNRVRVGES